MTSIALCEELAAAPDLHQVELYAAHVDRVASGVAGIAPTDVGADGFVDDPSFRRWRRRRFWTDDGFTCAAVTCRH